MKQPTNKQLDPIFSIVNTNIAIEYKYARLRKVIRQIIKEDGMEPKRAKRK